LGCNIAWGIVDAMMYLLDALASRGRALVVARALRANPSDARRILAEELPEPLVAVLDLDALGKRIATMPEPAARARLGWDDFRGALGVFLLVFLSTLPVVLPFTLITDPVLALRVSNGVAVVLLFVCGYSLARYSGHNPWWVGSAMVILGAALVAVTIALGG
jgi:VIT1/CCC1 family predicted Fe2+/Mn2+ transporter